MSTTVDLGQVIGQTGPAGPTGPIGPTGPAGENATTTEVASQTSNGLMSSSDKAKLDGITDLSYIPFGQGTPLKLGDYLDDYLTPGTYYSATNDISSSLLHTPWSNVVSEASVFTMYVQSMERNGTNAIRQTISGVWGDLYFRWYQNGVWNLTETNASWSRVFGGDNLFTGQLSVGGSIHVPDFKSYKVVICWVGFWIWVPVFTGSYDGNTYGSTTYSTTGDHLPSTISLTFNYDDDTKMLTFATSCYYHHTTGTYETDNVEIIQIRGVSG